MIDPVSSWGARERDKSAEYHHFAAPIIDCREARHYSAEAGCVPLRYALDSHGAKKKGARRTPFTPLLHCSPIYTISPVDWAVVRLPANRLPLDRAAMWPAE